MGQLQDRIVQFAQKTVKFAEQSRNFQKEVLTLLANSMHNTKQPLKGINCDIDALASVIIYQNTLLESLQKTRIILSSLNQVRLIGEVGQILDMEDIQLLADSSKQLDHTIFQQYPELLF